MPETVQAQSHRVDWMLKQAKKRIEAGNATAELASWALQHVAYPELMDAAAQIIARELCVAFVEVIELGPSDGAAQLVASVGFPRASVGIVDRGVAGVWRDTNDRPLLVHDWGNAGAVAYRPELHARGITCSMGIPIGLDNGQLPYGVVWLHSAERRVFTDREVTYVQGMAHELARAVARARATALPTKRLTPRERDVLRLLVCGWSNREIAAALGLAAGTVKNHVADILERLDSSDRTQAAVRAVELGLTQLH